MQNEAEKLTRKERLRRIKMIKEHFAIEPRQAVIDMYLSWPREKFDCAFQKMRRGERKRARELFASQQLRLVQYPLYGMVEIMCTTYYAYMAEWREAWGERSFKPIYAARYALHSRNRGWGVPRLNRFLAGVSSFKELLLLICAQPDEMPDRIEELRNWLEHQKEVNIPSATWSKEEALDSDIGSAENLGFHHSMRSKIEETDQN